ncbi:D-xylulose 5-phosphate/D-fructose 6-phosphate phosphoketolase [Ascobolus immersus RN42]|uniref:D-xylulose 5-phosphate/D-fructose 6-phosphate phosphoketolase n=1 Tax=Ascobolus immersus RN42 TaxID=1160509 RepID=A0A3N4IGE6_ASCIM|nr:D-xylulose 5-phosphate/D-fructose 6-phosphate phosphoketolase [Ascobolus immersus RN42]
MPGEQIPHANPSPVSSSLPDSVLDLAVNLPLKDALSESDRESVTKFKRAADYIAAAMIFLRHNILTQETLKPDDIKPRLLGHWGTCPGLTFIYTHLNLLLSKNPEVKALLTVGPGHGAPGILSSLWLEGSISKFYPDEYPMTLEGLTNLVRGFSTPGGFPSHINAETPGAIHEGGELGYALAVAYGAALDKPDLLSVVVVGDGESETGATAASWHCHKFIDPVTSGAVLPILHVNGFKISERTLPGTMDNKELLSLYSGYGYAVRIVEGVGSESSDPKGDIDANLAASLQWALKEIRSIQNDARNGKPRAKPRWPMLILKTPKGWGGPKQLDGKILEGSFHSHQVPLPAAKKDETQRKVLEDWLKSYKVEELIDPKTGELDEAIKRIIPKQRMGQLKESYDSRTPLDLPDWKDVAIQGVNNQTNEQTKSGEQKGQEEERPQQSEMKAVGAYLQKVIEKNPETFRIFSPDELESNKLDATLDESHRELQPDQYTKGNGRIIEVLSEHICQGLMQGYTLTGRTALFPSYESFLGIITTMTIQYSKFNKMAREVPFRGGPKATCGTIPSSINYLETSTWARQEHNGFSHQNPSFIGSILNLKASDARVYLPPDANCALSTIKHVLNSQGKVNLIVGSKQPTPVWLSPEEAEKHCEKGTGIWEFASTEGGKKPDVVLVGIGTEVTFEVVAAASLLKKLVPELRVRVVNVTDLFVVGREGSHPHALSEAEFADLFNQGGGVVCNYHGYAKEVQGLLFGRDGVENWSVEGYREEGSTTTPFDMLLRNHVSRYHVAIQAVTFASKVNDEVRKKQDEVVGELERRIKEHQDYLQEHGEDLEGTYDTPVF